MRWIPFLQSAFLLFSLSQSIVAQTIPVSDKAVFYNFTVSKCASGNCTTPYSVTLDNVNTVIGSFKGLNPRVTPVYDINDLVIAVYDKRSGKKRWETTVSNPIHIDVEYDAMGHQGVGEDTGSTLERKTIELDQGSVAVRLPFAQSDCTVSVGYVSAPNTVVHLATF